MTLSDEFIQDMCEKEHILLNLKRQLKVLNLEQKQRYFEEVERPQYIEFLVQNGISEALQAELNMECNINNDRTSVVLGGACFSFIYLDTSFKFSLSIDKGIVNYCGFHNNGKIVFNSSDSLYFKINKDSFQKTFCLVLSEIKRRKSLGWYANKVAPYEKFIGRSFLTVLVIFCIVTSTFNIIPKNRLDAVFGAVFSVLFVLFIPEIRSKKINQVIEGLQEDDD